MTKSSKIRFEQEELKQKLHTTMNNLQIELITRRILIVFTVLYFTYLVILVILSKSVSLSFITSALLILLFILVISFLFPLLSRIHKFSSSHTFFGIFLDLFPVFLLFIGYQSVSLVTEQLIYDRVNNTWLFDTEKVLFQWMFNGQMPNEWFSTTFQSMFVDVFFGLFYLFHTFPALLFGMYFFLKHDRNNYSYLIYTLLTLSLLCFLTFIIFPTSPPWYYRQFGELNPSADIDYSAYSIADLDRTDKIIGIPLIAYYYNTLGSTAFGAFPSMHAGFMFVATFAAYRKDRKLFLIMVLATLFILFGAVYFYHHYLIDLIAGLVYSLCAHFVTILLIKYEKKRREKKRKEEKRKI